MVVSLKAAKKPQQMRNEGNPAATQQGPDTGVLAALCAIACFHQVAADAATLAHQLGLQPSEAVSANDLLRAARQRMTLIERSQHEKMRYQHLADR